MPQTLCYWQRRENCVSNRKDVFSQTFEQIPTKSHRSQHKKLYGKFPHRPGVIVNYLIALHIINHWEGYLQKFLTSDVFSRISHDHSSLPSIYPLKYNLVLPDCSVPAVLLPQWYKQLCCNFKEVEELTRICSKNFLH